MLGAVLSSALSFAPVSPRADAIGCFDNGNYKIVGQAPFSLGFDTSDTAVFANPAAEPAVPVPAYIAGFAPAWARARSRT